MWHQWLNHNFIKLSCWIWWIKLLFLFSLPTKSILVSIIQLRLNYWCHMDYLNNVLTTFLDLERFSFSAFQMHLYICTDILLGVCVCVCGGGGGVLTLPYSPDAVASVQQKFVITGTEIKGDWKIKRRLHKDKDSWWLVVWWLLMVRLHLCLPPVSKNSTDANKNYCMVSDDNIDVTLYTLIYVL